VITPCDRAFASSHRASRPTQACTGFEPVLTCPGILVHPDRPHLAAAPALAFPPTRECSAPTLVQVKEVDVLPEELDASDRKQVSATRLRAQRRARLRRARLRLAADAFFSTAHHLASPLAHSLPAQLLAQLGVANAVPRGVAARAVRAILVYVAAKGAAPAAAAPAGGAPDPAPPARGRPRRADASAPVAGAHTTALFEVAWDEAAQREWRSYVEPVLSGVYFQHIAPHALRAAPPATLAALPPPSPPSPRRRLALLGAAPAQVLGDALPREVLGRADLVARVPVDLAHVREAGLVLAHVDDQLEGAERLLLGDLGHRARGLPAGLGRRRAVAIEREAGGGEAAGRRAAGGARRDLGPARHASSEHQQRRRRASAARRGRGAGGVLGERRRRRRGGGGVGRAAKREAPQRARACERSGRTV